jgi:hypothetical protein
MLRSVPTNPLKLIVGFYPRQINAVFALKRVPVCFCDFQCCGSGIINFLMQLEFSKQQIKKIAT